jgi:hypothetical protein
MEGTSFQPINGRDILPTDKWNYRKPINGRDILPTDKWKEWKEDG